MEIIKLPVDTKIICECGCEFEFNTNDVEQVGYEILDGTVYSRVVVDCPFCQYRHTLQEKTINHKKGDKQ